MATKQTPKKAVPGKSLTKWEEELAKRAQIAANMEANAIGQGNFISLRGGQLKYRDNIVPGNKMNVIVLDHLLEYTYYVEDFDPDNPQNPDAFALGRDENTIRWHENSLPEYAGELCKDSDINQWGSADKGRGKAAKNQRRLILITEDALDNIEDAQPAMLKVPVMSVAGWAGYVKQLADTLKRPTLGVVTEISVVPDPKSQFRVQFKYVRNVPNDKLEGLFAKCDAVQAQLNQPYQPREDAPADKPARGAKARGKPTKKAAPPRRR